MRQTTECDPIQNGEKYEETCQVLCVMFFCRWTTGHGEERIVLLLLVVVVEGEGALYIFQCTVFGGVKWKKLCVKRGVKRQKLCLKRGVKRQRLCLKMGVKRQRLCVKRGVKWNKLLHHHGALICLKMLHSTPQISERIPFLSFCRWTTGHGVILVYVAFFIFLFLGGQ